MGISRIFDIARRSMGVYQKALHVTSHNIANASNPAYSRQSVILGTENPELNAGFFWGTGVKISDIQRLRHQFADAQIRSNNQKFYDNSQRSILLAQVEGVFTEPSDLGLGNITNEFFNSWSELAGTPNSASLRDNVIQVAKKMSNKIKNISESFDTLKSDILLNVKGKVNELNNHLKSIQVLNKQIVEFEAIGQNANDLLDKRDEAIDELSKLVNINVAFDDKNSALISVGGVYAVDGSYVTQFKPEVANDELSILSSDGTKIKLTSGELGAAADIYSNKIPEYRNKLETIVNTIMETVNNFHRQGYSLDIPPQTNIDFFEGFQNGELKINSEILSNSNKISISTDGTSGNGDMALKIADIGSSKLVNGTTLTEFYTNLISGIGNDKLYADNIMDSTDIILSQLEQEKSSVSGVSLDEEMTNIIKFQRSYDASAKLIQVADEMIQTLLAMV